MFGAILRFMADWWLGYVSLIQSRNSRCAPVGGICAILGFILRGESERATRGDVVQLIAVSRRRLAGDPAKYAVELGQRLKPGRERRFADTHVRIEKHLLRFLDSG